MKWSKEQINCMNCENIKTLDFFEGRYDLDTFDIWYYYLAKKDMTIASRVSPINFAIILIKEKLIEPYYFLYEREDLIRFKIEDKVELEKFVSQFIESHYPKEFNLIFFFLAVKNFFGA